ncbi:MAG: ribonuclease [Chloroflexota bacterium]|nr:ribonuclease [Chloroflexota bacterium]
MTQRQRPTTPSSPRKRQTQLGVGSLLLIGLVYLLQQLLGGGAVTNSTAAPATPTRQATAVEGKVQAETPLPNTTATPKARKNATTAPTSKLKAAPVPTATPTAETRAGPAGLPVITFGELPPEALDTLELIQQGGPFPYEKDGATFQNREDRLPRHPRGYYREYTVETPGSDDRGARRMIAGDAGELYYTDDHYDSFAWVVQE